MRRKLMVELFPKEIALIKAHLFEQVSHASNEQLYTCGKLFCIDVGISGYSGILDMEMQSIKEIQKLVDDDCTAFFLAKHVESEEKTDG
jgi:hypothetical protein